MKKSEISKMMSELARHKWSKVSKKERQAHALKMNEARKLKQLQGNSE